MSKKILVAESDNAVQQVVSYFLNLEGFDVTTAEDGVMALEMTEKISPEVIVLDPNLSGINGIEVSRLIQDKSEYKNIPILFLADEKAGEVIPSGFGIINKPIDPTRLVNTIKEYSDRVQESVQMIQENDESVNSSGTLNIEELLGWDVAEVTGENDSGQETAGPDMTELHDQDQSPEMNAEEEKFASPAQENKVNVEAELRDRITEDMIENMIRTIASEITERVVGEIVPKIAEEEIKKEIERIKSEGE